MAACVLAVLAGCASRPGIGEQDVRVRADVRQVPWRSIGLVRTDVGARCTGALVGRRTVLTAAHCLHDPRTLGLVAPGQVAFLLPPAGQPLAVQARAAGFVTGSGFALEPGPRPSPRSRPDADWALISLDTDLAPPEFFLPLAPILAPPGTMLAYGGYQADQPRVLLADFSCQILGYGRDPAGAVMMRHSCTGTHGASGGPLLGRLSDGRWVVVGIGSLARNAGEGGWAVPAMTVGREMLAMARAAPR